MAYVPPSTKATGTLITAAIWNQDIVENVGHVASFTHGGTSLALNSPNKEIGWFVGDYKASAMNLTAQGTNKWMLCDGRTIGTAGSGATARANGDMQGLFIHLWTWFTNTELPIQDSAGTPTTRGASAAADFTAQKRLPLPDLRGCTLVMMDNPGTGAANRVTGAWADLIGGRGGAESHVLTIGQLAQHAHTLSTSYGSTAHTAGASSQSSGPGGGAVASGPFTTLLTGNNDPHNIVQPSFAVNYYIYSGN
jgi:microcystin-dependent protein